MTSIENFWPDLKSSIKFSVHSFSGSGRPVKTWTDKLFSFEITQHQYLFEFITWFDCLACCVHTRRINLTCFSFFWTESKQPECITIRIAYQFLMLNDDYHFRFFFFFRFSSFISKIHLPHTLRYDTDNNAMRSNRFNIINWVHFNFRDHSLIASTIN